MGCAIDKHLRGPERRTSVQTNRLIQTTRLIHITSLLGVYSYAVRFVFCAVAVSRKIRFDSHQRIPASIGHAAEFPMNAIYFFKERSSTLAFSSLEEIPQFVKATVIRSR